MTDKPGDGIRSLRTSNMFRALNFELYARPNKMIMVFGSICFAGCFGYIWYIRQKYEKMGYYPVVTEAGEEIYARKKSKWEK